MDIQTFRKKVASIRNRGTKFTADVDELLQDAINSAQGNGDFNRAGLLLDALWDARMYGMTRTCIEYLTAHGPFVIRKGTNEDGQVSYNVKKDRSDAAINFVEKRVPFYQWEKPKVEAALTLDKAYQRFENLFEKAHSDLEEDELSAFNTMVLKKLGVTDQNAIEVAQ